MEWTDGTFASERVERGLQAIVCVLLGGGIMVYTVQCSAVQCSDAVVAGAVSTN